MHPEVIKTAPGKCPICGMDLVPKTDHGGDEPSPSLHTHTATQATAIKPQQHTRRAAHDHSAMQHSGHGRGPNPPMGHAGHDHHAMINDFKKRFYIVLVLTIPIMLLSTMIQHWLNMPISFPGSQYVLLLLSSIVFFYGGWPFLTGWIGEMRTRNPGMMTLIGFAITVAYLYSLATVFGLQGMDFFWELATLILIMLLGHWIEMRSVAGASRELELLIQLMPDEAHLVQGDQLQEVKTDTLKAKDTVLIKPGEKVPADGTVIKGATYLNESMLTGESKPVEKKEGDPVIAGSINGNGAIHISVTHGAADSYLSQVIKLVQDAQQSKSRTQLLADKAARWLTLLAIVAGITTFLAWYLSGKDLAFSIERMVTVIVICCPHALGLAVPLVVARSTALSARHGLLIKNRTAFENARKIATLVFDKTGTLTIGKFEVAHMTTMAGISDKELLKYAAALEQSSEHPIATGILQKAKEEGLPILPVQDFKAITGQGVSATVAGKAIKVVSPGYLQEKNLTIPGGSNGVTGTTVYVLINDQPAGSITLSDKIRPESKEAIATLRAHHIQSVLLTGDNKQVAASVAKELSIDSYFAEVLPHQKLEKIKELQSKGTFVAMTGDGVNDAPALAQADVGIAVGSGSDITAETADIILVNSNPKDVVNLILFGKATYRKMVQNLVWATGYNVVALPLAAGILWKAGILLSPAAGAVLMSVSTVVVAINASILTVRKD